VTGSPARRADFVESFFQFSMIGLVASGFLALAGSGHLDIPTSTLVCAGLLLRAAMVLGWIRLKFSGGAIAAVAAGYIALYALDLFVISRDAFAATVHGVCFIALLKIVTAESDRDYGYVGIIAFLELLTAALLSFRATFFAWLALFVFFAIAAFTSSEIRGSFRRFETRAAQPGIRLTWRLAALTCAAAAFTLALTAGLFLLIPRTARAAALWFPSAASHGITGFSDRIDLGRFGDIVKDDRPVMRVRPYLHALPPNLKWRGSALSSFDGRRWTEPAVSVFPGRRITGTVVVADRWQRSRRDGSRFVYRVDLADTGSGTLFIAGVPEYLNVDAPRIVLTPEDSFRVPARPGEPLRYEVSAHSGPPLDYELSPGERRRDLALPPQFDLRIRALARQWAGDGDDRTEALRILTHLRSGFNYTLDMPRVPPRDPLANFLFVRKAGYCEYFASAMAVMLRTLGIPSRVATGFQSGYFNDVSGMYVIRASDAHAWVEAWIDGQGWRTFDPTPPDKSPSHGLFARLGMYLDAADSQWQQWVVSYDFMHQVELASRFQNLLRAWSQAGAMGSSPWTARDIRRALAWAARGMALGILFVLMVVFGPRLWRDFRRQRQLRRIARTGGAPSDARVLYERMLDLLARRGYQKPAWFTPAEFAGGLPPGVNGDVTRFTALYNRARYGGDASVNLQMTELLESIAQLPRK
jgi:protein-glutamine gamma-glutamyltransferase